MLQLILWVIGIWCFFSSGLGLLCLYLFLRMLRSPYFWCAGYLLYVWANKH